MVLTPTRELAVQISEQFGALGALMGLRHTVVIGGVGALEQSLELSGTPTYIRAYFLSVQCCMSLTFTFVWFSSSAWTC